VLQAVGAESGRVVAHVVVEGLARGESVEAIRKPASGAKLNN
jgi:hypothetical protein